MAAIRKAVSRFDPYKNFKFKIVSEGRAVGAFNALTPAHVLKITGMNKSTDVTLKRGVIGDPGLFDWLNSVRGGRTKKDRRDLTVEQYDETGCKRRSVTLLSCRVLDFQALADEEADANAFAVTKLTLNAERSRQDPSLQPKPKKMRVQAKTKKMRVQAKI